MDQTTFEFYHFLFNSLDQCAKKYIHDIRIHVEHKIIIIDLSVSVMPTMLCKRNSFVENATAFTFILSPVIACWARCCLQRCRTQRWRQQRAQHAMTGERIKVKAVAFSTNEFLLQSIVGITLTERSIMMILCSACIRMSCIYFFAHWSKLLKRKWSNSNVVWSIALETLPTNR